MQDYFQTMDEFLATQQDVMRVYLGGGDEPALDLAEAGDPTPASGAPSAGDYPLLGEVVASEPGKVLVAERTFDPAEDLYLRDHTLGRHVSTKDPELTGLAIMPLTLSLEILAEAAACLMPGQLVIGLRDVRANRWLAWDDQPVTLRVTARRLPGPEAAVQVELRNLTEDRQQAEPPTSPVVEAVVRLADAYPSPPAPLGLSLPDARPSRWAPGRLYLDAMFHGPTWQGVAAIDETGASGAIASLGVLPFDGFFRSRAAPRFQLDPVTLDAAGQVIGFWTMEHLTRGRVIFPYRLDALEIYGPLKSAGERLTCAAAIQLPGEQQVRSDIEVLDADGRPWMRLIGWEDKRFDPPAPLLALMIPSGEVEASSEWREPIARFPDSERYSCRRVPVSLTSDRALWKQVWAQRILSGDEREQFAQLRTPEHRQLEWLAGRTAAKDAVRRLVRAHYGLDLPYADVEIRADAQGRPVAVGTWLESLPAWPAVSIAHAGGEAVALAGLLPRGVAASTRRPGIDLEPLRGRPEGFAEAGFDAREQQLLEGFPPEQREEWTLRCWCAKEAVGKALGQGLAHGTSSVRVAAVDAARGLVATAITGQLAAQFPELASGQLAVYTSREGGLVVATTLCEPLAASVTGRALGS